MDKVLKFYRYVDGGVNDTPFPNSEDQVEIGSFRYDAKRMGSAPTISATVMHSSCLDNEWTNSVYAEFMGEKYFLKQTPTSSYSNEDSLYKHELTLVSARAILDNVLFYDAVVGDPQGEDKPVSNSTKFVFFGKIDEFARRLNASLQYAKLQKVDENGEYESGYRVIVDNGITSEAMFVSFEDQYFSNAIQESYNTFKVPYYFVGEDIHFGNSNGVIEHEFSYGIDDALLSITKSNANNKIVNRVTGKGSSENIPYYYPNNSAKGIVEAVPSSGFEVKILDYEKFADAIAIDGILRKSGVGYENALVTFNKESIFSGKTFSARMGAGGIKQYFDVSFTSKDVGIFLLNFSSSVIKYLLQEEEKEDATIGVVYSFTVYDDTDKKWIQESKGLLDAIDNLEVQVPYANHKYIISITCYYAAEGKYAGKGGNIVFDASYSFGSKSGWVYEDKVIELKDAGLVIEGEAIVGSTITQKSTSKITNSNVLMPPIYRNSYGSERFYNAINYPYPKPSNFDETLENGYYGEDGILRNPYGEYEVEGYIHNDAYKKEDGTYIHFNNPFVEGQPKEHIISVDDIKPTIKEAVNASGLRLDMFTAFAYDEDDNDETYVDDNGETIYEHPYFFGKLRVLDFNLFECANENQPMTISFTSGHCGACNFEIGATEDYPQLNPVQVTGEGELIYKDGRVWCGLEGVEGQEVTEYQDRQQDTSKYEVWIALKKEEETYGALMPSESIRPKACSSPTADDGDTFVILGINLPESYITNAEERLEAEIIKYMKDNNDEKFNFSITLSRIFFAENPTILEQLNENASLYVWYNGVRYPLYVSSISYNMGEGEVLPEVRLELVDSLSVSQNAIQAAISQVKAQMGNALANLDVLTAVTPFFIRKDQDDEVRGRVNFTKGIKFGEGGKVEVLDNNSAKLTIEYLEVTKKASFTSLEIQEKTHVGGQMLVTPAAINCGEVEELEDAYRCYFQTKGEDGEEIFNQFAVGDQAICQTYNAWGSKYYWRLVTGIGEDYIDLSKTECDEDSDEPSEGDKIIQLGNQVDTSRQNAIVIAAYGDGSPYIIQYKGINSFEIGDDKIVTKLSSTENIFTGKVHMELGSDGLENLNLEIGGQNMLRNSGFTGDYLSSSLADEDVLDAATELFSSPLEHWGHAGASVQNSTESQSGKELVLTNGRIAQTLYQKVVSGESYVLSFKAKGTSLTYSVGGVIKTVGLTNEWVGYVEKIVVSNTSDIFSITDATCVLCDLQLERGTMATKWGNSPFDNSSDRAYYQSLKYLQDALEGSTDVLGGLVLTEQVHVGDYDKEKKEWVKMSGGMSGIYEDDNDVAFWAGGSFDKAIEASMKYADNPTYQPTEEELASMANFVVTHGGRAILNDAIVRGKIYASGGVFRGDVYFGENSEGLENTKEWKDIDGRIGDAEKKLVNINEDLENIQNQIDGVVENYFLEGMPTTDTVPVTDWKGESEDDDYALFNHIGDTYTDITEYIDDDTTPTAGKSWRWCECTNATVTDKIEVTDKDGNKKYLHWHPIADSDAVKALQEAAKAKSTADGKSRTFVAQPYPPYDKGDLWSQGADGDLMVCKTPKASGYFDASDWVKASSYTDGSNIENLLPDSSSIPKTYNNSWYWSSILLPIRVNSGETYTFKCESSRVVSGAQPSYRIRIDDGTKGEVGVTNVFTPYASNIEFGENKTATLTILDGVVDREAYLTIVRTKHDSSKEDSLVFNNVSLVRGTTPMSAWEDYRGDAALDNLLLTEEEFDGQSTEYAYAYIDLPNNVNGGEQYTVSIESLRKTTGSTGDTQYDIEIASKDSTYTPKSNAITIDFLKRAWGTMTIWDSAVDMPARLAIRKKTPNTATAAKIKGLSLVKGPIPLMTWKESRAIFKQISASIGSAQTAIDSANSRIDQLGVSNSNLTTELNTQKGKVEQAQQDLQNVYTKAEADGKIDDAEKAAIEAAEKALADAVEELKRMLAELEGKIVNDYGYLKTAFGSITAGDVFLSKMMGVGLIDSNNNVTVNAFMNGSSAIKGTDEEGKLMLATGIPSTGGELPQRANNATTRIYEMGKIVTNQIEAKGGLIGNFKIVEGKNLEYVDETTEAEMILNEKGITFYSNGAWKTGSYAHLGNGCDGGVVLQVIGDKTRGGYCHGAAVGENVGIHVMSDKAAIFCDEGMFYGLRPKTHKAQAASELTINLTEFDHTEIAEGKVNYILPAQPKTGQCYRIIKTTSTGGATLTASGSTTIHDLITNSNKGTTYSLPTNVRMFEIVWDGNSKWYVDGASH